MDRKKKDNCWWVWIDLVISPSYPRYRQYASCSIMSCLFLLKGKSPVSRLLFFLREALWFLPAQEAQLFSTMFCVIVEDKRGDPGRNTLAHAFCPRQWYFQQQLRQMPYTGYKKEERYSTDFQDSVLTANLNKENVWFSYAVDFLIGSIWWSWQAWFCKVDCLRRRGWHCSKFHWHQASNVFASLGHIFCMQFSSAKDFVLLCFAFNFLWCYVHFSALPWKL